MARRWDLEEALRRIANHGRLAVRSSVDQRAKAYDRARDLPALVGLAPDEVERSRPVGARLLRRIGRALRRERWRGRAGHGDYDVARHLALLQAWKAESGALASATPLSGTRDPADTRAGGGAGASP